MDGAEPSLDGGGAASGDPEAMGWAADGGSAGVAADRRSLPHGRKAPPPSDGPIRTGPDGPHEQVPRTGTIGPGPRSARVRTYAVGERGDEMRFRTTIRLTF